MADQVLLLLDGVPVAGPPHELRQSPDARIAGFLSEEADESFDAAEAATPQAEPRATHASAGP
jgi:hypothetical protein